MTITKWFTFEAAHHLPKVPAGHKCAAMHGHSYKVTVEVGGKIDSTYGWLVDYAVLARAWDAEVHAAIDHKTLNDITGLENPTTEVLALWILRRLIAVEHTLCGAWVKAVTVKESMTTSCTVTRADAAARPFTDPGKVG